MAAALAESALGCTVLVLDDGFQHTAMTRDVDVVIVTSEDLTDRRLPFGRLRSPVSDLSRADAVVVDGPWTEAAATALRGAVSVEQTRLFSLSRAIGEARLIEQPDVVLTKTASVVAVAGIARPERFTESLEASGWHVARLLSFSDHHPYDRGDLQQMAKALRATGAAAIVTTEKDAVRLLPLRPLGVPVASVPLTIRLTALHPSSADDEFEAWLLQQVRRVRR
jgi:tetraacyldisaccharide 4'-kinase